MSQASFLAFRVLSGRLYFGLWLISLSVIQSNWVKPSRCLNGMLNGNIGVMKSMLAELTDETNVARGCSLMSITWAVGGTVGSDILILSRLLVNVWIARPFIGGVLSRPQDRWPNVFSHPFWGKYPYFLPCLATSAYGLVLFSVAAISLKEVGSSLL